MWRDVRDRLLRPLRRGPLTAGHPAAAPSLAPAARGLPVLDPTRCDASGACVATCPTRAITVTEETWRLDLGRCIFCAACEDACPQGAIALTGRIELAAQDRSAVIVTTPIVGTRS